MLWFKKENEHKIYYIKCKTQEVPTILQCAVPIVVSQRDDSNNPLSEGVVRIAHHHSLWDLVVKDFNWTFKR